MDFPTEDNGTSEGEPKESKGKEFYRLWKADHFAIVEDAITSAQDVPSLTFGQFGEAMGNALYTLAEERGRQSYTNGFGSGKSRAKNGGNNRG